MSGKIEISPELARLLYQDTVSCWGVGGNAANQLRAILGSPVAERQGPVAWIKPKTLEALTPSGMVYVTGFDLGDSIPLYTSSAAPVVERQPVCEVIDGERGSRTLLWLPEDLPPIGTKLYAEPPAPVAVVDPYAIADAVRASLDRKACPNVWMVIAYEAVVDKVKELNQ